MVHHYENAYYKPEKGTVKKHVFNWGKNSVKPEDGQIVCLFQRHHILES